jgi:hypothetical protein
VAPKTKLLYIAHVETAHVEELWNVTARSVWLLAVLRACA